MASGASYSPLREEPTDRLDFQDSSPYRDEESYPNAESFRVQAVETHGQRNHQSTKVRGCSKLSAVMLLCMVLLAIFLIALIASMARPQCIPSIKSIKPPASSSAPATVTTAIKTATPTAANGEIFPWTDIRLPQTVKPLHYDLNLQTDLTNFQVKGFVDISFQAISAENFIVMHVKNISLTQPNLKSTTEQAPHVSKMLINEYHEQVYFGLDRMMSAGNNYSLTLQFAYSLSETLEGYYRSSYTANGQKRFLASTQFEPTSARRAFPCFDEPQLKATFSMKMTRAKGLLSLFNTALKQTIPISDTLEQDIYDVTVPMSTYLVAFVVCDFVKISNTTLTGTAISVYTSPEKIGQAHLALDVLQKTIPYYEQFFGVDYPLSKQDMIAIPDFSAGAMENWGLITYREASMLYQEGVTSSGRMEWIVQTITHELAHQWFGNLVTMEWWNDLWLNEGFASYVEFIGTDNYNKTWQMMDQFTVFTTQIALEADSHGNSHPISVVVKDPNEINAIFDSISYNKGSAIIRMLHDFLPENAFHNGLKYYLQKYKFSNANTKDLWDSISEANRYFLRSNGILSDMMDTWTLQMGYPVVNLTRQGLHITATQEHFLHFPSAVSSKDFISPYNYRWTIPLTYVTSNNATRKAIFMDKSKTTVTFTLDGNVKWYKGNSEQSGFYRVNYDSANWDALITQLIDDHTQLTTADRANLVDDAFSLAWAGKLSQTKSLDLSLYLLNEREYGPINSGLSNLMKIGNVMQNTEGYSSYVDYMLKLLAPQIGVFNQTGWEKEVSHLQSFLKNIVLYDAVIFGHLETVEYAKNIFREWKERDTPVPANLRTAVYCAGIMYGRKSDWDFCWNKYQTTLAASEARVLLSALACTHDPVLINRYLHWSLDDSKVPSQDAVTVISGIASHPAGVHAALAFLIEKWNIVVERYGGSPFEMTHVIQAVTSSISRQFEYDQASQFFISHFNDSKAGQRTVQQSLENMQANIGWLVSHEKEVTQWFRDHTN